MKRNIIEKIIIVSILYFIISCQLFSQEKVKINREILIADLKYLSSKKLEGRKPSSAGSKIALQYISNRFELSKIEKFKNSYFQSFSFVYYSIKGLILPERKFKTEFVDAQNIYGYINGNKYPNKFIVISAHYDHLGIKAGEIYPGADDNASGVAAMFSLGDYFSKNQPNHSLIFAAFDGEELGMHGVRYFFDNLPVSKNKIVLNINLDMLSRNDKNQIFASGLVHYKFLIPEIEKIKKISKVEIMYGHDTSFLIDLTGDDWTTRGDHTLFYENNIPYIYFGVEDHPDYHKPTDTFENINQDFYYNVAEMVLQFLLLLDFEIESIVKSK